MTDLLQHMLRDEAERIDVPPPPIEAILADGRRRRRANRGLGALAVAASVVTVVGGVVGLSRLVADDGQRQSPAPAGTPTMQVTTEPNVVGGTLDVSGSGVGAHRFGTSDDEVLADVSARLGEPDLTVGPTRYGRVPGSDGWFEDPDDPLSPSWQYPVASVQCWEVFCLVFGGEDADTLQLRGWELAEYRRWSPLEEADMVEQPDVRLAGTGIRLGDSWERLHAAYPDTVTRASGGASLAVENTPWPAVFDGAGGWRVSGQGDHARPDEVPDGAVVTRLSGGEGPEPGCC